ncbi:hypothetical protein L202_07997 [Cryptococcus amylolentus CBS 6039]|uniref:CSC1/OSCA1-like 7TM region domain-containing protein n=1 Tax=Cryptococcus amylolentus CBS 6039 TaxID=1295533 RepID=A0A1E3HAX3_9TREE|nr:hypothetical protein L202_07997 [Cryptococcus amylolentus CBS 6039]ODN73492.1 hypothetical protein L202_07997 [Cryptococcus amylolentus CBS 6039]
MPPYPARYRLSDIPHARGPSFHRQIIANLSHTLAARADDADTTTQASASTTTNGITASDLIEEAEEHWNVSAKSILAAWALTAAGALLIVLIYSAARPRWKLIYLPRLKVRKTSRTPEEKRKEKEMLDKMSARDRKAYMDKKEENKPDYYPDGENLKGKWVARAPRAVKGYLGWLKPTWRETMVELRSALPRWMDFLIPKETVTDEKGRKIKQSASKPSLFEQDLKTLHMLGLDAIVYLIFLRLLKYLFTVVAFLACLLAIANFYLNTQTSYGGTSAVSPTEALESARRRAETSTASAASSNSTSVSTAGSNSTSIIENPQLLTAANITSNGLLVHISFEWIVTMMVVVFVLKACAHHLKLVQEWTHMNYSEVSFKTLMITNLAIRPNPSKSISTVADAKREIKSLILGPHRSKVDSSVWFAVHNMNPLHEKMEEFKKKKLKWAIKAVSMETFYESGEGVFYDSCSGRLCGLSKSAQDRVDDALTEKRNIEHLQDQIRKGQVDVKYTKLKGTVTSAFLTVPTAKKAREVLKDSKDKLKEAGYHIQRAPRSQNVLWQNLERDGKSRHSHAVLGKVILVIICFINTIPVMIVTVLANLNTAINRWPTLAKLAESSDIWNAIFTVIAGILPATIAALFSYILPYIMRRLSRWSGALTRGQLDKAVIRQLFIFLLVSNFIVFSLLGVLYETYLTISEDIGQESWSTIYASLGDVPAKITRAYISESLYWLSWYPIRSVVAFLQLLQIPRLIKKTPQLLTIKTPHDLAEVAQPENFEYSHVVCSIILELQVLLMYAPLAPVVVICAAIYFWVIYVVHTNQIKYVFDSKETDGKCWKIIINRVLVATVMMQILMVLTVTLKTRSAAMAVGAGLPIGVIFLFKMYLRRHYHPDGELFSQYIDKYEDDDLDVDNYAPEYEHELLREDWMPKFKTVKNKVLMARAMKRFPKLTELLKVGQDEPVTGTTKKSKKKKRR